MTLPVSGNTEIFSIFLYVETFLPSTNKRFLAPLGLSFNPFFLLLFLPLFLELLPRSLLKAYHLSSFTTQGLSSGVIFPPASPETLPSSLPMRGFFKRFITRGLSTLWLIAHPPSLDFPSKPYFFWLTSASTNSSSQRKNFLI